MTKIEVREYVSTEIEVQEYVREARARGYEEGASVAFLALIVGALSGALVGVAATLCWVHL